MDVLFTLIYTKLEVPATSSLASLQQCVATLHAWFSQNALLLNTDKSEVILFTLALDNDQCSRIRILCFLSDFKKT